ncbi:MAG TPA: helix-turn-helix domain-containing protein [Solirubrobacteraceae bacterium]
MSEDIGRRETNKRATRAAIREAAERLVAEQGFEATTVRQIADAAQVTERTFYRYFDGKVGLVTDQATAWMERLHDAIRDRPPEEEPLEAVARGIGEMVRQASANPGNAPLWLFADTPQQYALLQRSAPRPLMRFEASIADAVVARTGDSAEARRRADLLARVSVAVLRSAAIHRQRLLTDGARRLPEVEELLREEFASLVELSRAGV